MPTNSSFFKSFFFGNYFYGICAVALCIEASLQQYVPLNSFAFYAMIFCGTIVFYTKAYITDTVLDHHNKRSVWYVQHKQWVYYSQLFFSALLIVFAFAEWKDDWKLLLQLNSMQWQLILIFPVVAFLYYGLPAISTFNLRNTGWLKPFVIGFVWAGMANIYPVLVYHIHTHTPYDFTIVSLLLFIKNFMYISLLGIMFDIKDYAADHNQQLKTFVVQSGLRKTIFFIIIPLSIIGLGTFWIYAFVRHFPALRILINTIPFILLIIATYSMHRRKSILYYLAIIDGLMLIKACCGSIGILLIK